MPVEAPPARESRTSAGSCFVSSSRTSRANRSTRPYVTARPPSFSVTNPRSFSSRSTRRDSASRTRSRASVSARRRASSRSASRARRCSSASRRFASASFRRSRSRALRVLSTRSVSSSRSRGVEPGDRLAEVGGTDRAAALREAGEDDRPLPRRADRLRALPSEEPAEPGDQPGEPGPDPGEEPRALGPHPRRVREEEGRADVVHEAVVDLRPVEPSRPATPLLRVRELGGELRLGPPAERLQLGRPAVVLPDEPLDPARCLTSEPLPEFGDPGGQRRVPARLVGDERLRRIDPALGEGPDQGRPVDEVEDVVRADVFGVLRAVRQFDRGLRGGRRRPRPRSGR